MMYVLVTMQMNLKRKPSMKVLHASVSTMRHFHWLKIETEFLSLKLG